jgi:hypothetical protein
MPESNQTDQLLTEIRDLLARQENKYEEHLIKARHVYDEHRMAWQSRSRSWVLVQWAGYFVVVYLAVFFAMRSLH